MLGGEFRHNLDSKNRIFIPAKLRDELGSTFVVARDIREKCLKLYSMQAWEEYMKPLKEQNRKLREQIYRMLSATMEEVTPDAQGRVVLPKGLVEYAGITRETVVVGCFEYAEIWAADAYDRMNADADEKELLAELEALGL